MDRHSVAVRDDAQGLIGMCGRECLEILNALRSCKSGVPTRPLYSVKIELVGESVLRFTLHLIPDFEVRQVP